MDTISQQMFVTLYDYNRWANHRVWDCVMALSDAQFSAPNDYSVGSIHRQVAHMMSVEYWWLKYIITGELDYVSEADCATRESIRARWDETETMIHEYVATLTPEELARKIKPPEWDETKPAITVYEALYQVAIHSADHRAQVLAALHQVGGKTTPQDVIFYKFDTAGVPWVDE